MIELRPLDRSNWRRAAGLRLTPGQEGLVSPNVYSIAESAFEPHYCPRLILASGVPVGFLMYCVETDPPDPEVFWLFRLMIDATHQGKGYGREALRVAVLEMQAAGARRIRAMHRPHNEPAARLYQGAGFVAIGTLEDGDVELRLDIDQG